MRPVAVTDFVLKRRRSGASLSDVEVALGSPRVGLGWGNGRASRRPHWRHGRRGNDTIDDEAGWCLRETAEAPQGGRDPPIFDRRSSMKYVVSWQPRPNMTEEMQARSLQVFEKWSPAEGTNFLQFLGRIDGPGGFAVVETDDPALLALDTAIFSNFFDMTVYPVLDVQEAARIGGEALEFIRSA
jgi:Protein of unknown function (DUF3303)